MISLSLGLEQTVLSSFLKSNSQNHLVHVKALYNGGHTGSRFVELYSNITMPLTGFDIFKMHILTVGGRNHQLFVLQM